MKSPHARGFSLAEMIVVLAIIVSITGIVLTGQENFNRTLRSTDTAYTVALSIRQAQTYGLSSRTFGGAGNAGYGIHIGSTTPQLYLLFADVSKLAGIPAYCPVGVAGQPDQKPGNCLYDPTGSELVQTYTFGRGFIIGNACGHDLGDITRCTGDGYLTGIDMTFIRPNTDSVITGLRGVGNIQLKDAQIQILTPAGGGTRYVCLTRSGEVSVASTTCP